MAHETSGDDFKLPDEKEIRAFALRFARDIAEQLHAKATTELNAKGHIDAPAKLMECFEDCVMEALYELSSASFEEREGVTPARAAELNKRMEAELAKAVL